MKVSTIRLPSIGYYNNGIRFDQMMLNQHMDGSIDVCDGNGVLMTTIHDSRQLRTVLERIELDVKPHHNISCYEYENERACLSY